MSKIVLDDGSELKIEDVEFTLSMSNDMFIKCLLEKSERIKELKDAVCERDWRNTELIDALKAICKRFGVSTKWSAEDAAKKVLEALERDYMELPKDADGVPIRVGDDVVRTNDRLQPETVRVIGVNDGSVFFKHEGRVKQNVAHNLHHVKPRTLESVLADLANEVWEASCTCQTTWSDSGLDGIEKKYADEIRELMEAER